jgi:para-aminobenzoate synthetase/4-amino-4-deoxychorismate lyase
VVLQAPGEDGIRWIEFLEPTEILQTSDLAKVRSILDQVDRTAASGQFAAGFVSYEAAPAFDAALRTARPAGPPLVWFGLFDQYRVLEPAPTEQTKITHQLDWQPSLSTQAYYSCVETIHRHIANGDTYQVNFTFPLEADLNGVEPWELFVQLCHQQKSNCCAFVDAGDWVVCSSSPELFFELVQNRIICRPMKGTVRRGRTVHEDEKNAEWLRNSAKNRAENVMIVDMVRNDLGRIADPKTVEVTRLWELEKYPSLFQLTSTVEAETEAKLPEIFSALFPCASITGAPKIRASEIIADLELQPRGVYTGAIGYVGPHRQARFNVAIRTVQIDRKLDLARYGTGGGNVWESSAEDEWLECQTKGLVLRSTGPDFDLLETLLWTPTEGFLLLERHLERLRDSAIFFGYRLDLDRVRGELNRQMNDGETSDKRIRLMVSEAGVIRIETAMFDSDPSPWRVALASDPVDSGNHFLFHKTTNRTVYDQRRLEFPDFDDVILWNEKRELTESTLANIVLRTGDRLYTPPIDSGLLAGTMRAELLEQGRIMERSLKIEDLFLADELFLINSVRGWIDTRLVSPRAGTRFGLSQSVSAESD